MLMPSHRKRQQTTDEMLGELWKLAAANGARG
jgi:hypothetical protein